MMWPPDVQTSSSSTILPFTSLAKRYASSQCSALRGPPLRDFICRAPMVLDELGRCAYCVKLGNWKPDA